MEDNKEKVIEVTENVEPQSTEENVEEKIYTEADFNRKLDETMAKRMGRLEAKLRRKYEEKYSGYKEAEAVLNAGLETSNISEATDKLREFYESKGITIPAHNSFQYSEDDLKVLVNNEAQKIIEYGIEDVIEEVDRLADKGLENMSAREKLLFNQLANHRKEYEEKKELAEIGVNADVLKDEGFIEFSKDLNPKLSTKEKYEKYMKYKPKKDIEPIGSMGNTYKETTGIKDYYSYEEAKKFTKADFDKNPALFNAVQKSMTKWK